MKKLSILDSLMKKHIQGSEDLKFRKILFQTEKPDKSLVSFPRKLITYFIYLLLVVAVVYFVFISDLFRIKNIKVENVKSIEIEDYVKISLQGKNILFMLPGRYLKELVERFPVLEQARIVRGLPNTVKVVVDEREYRFIWCNAENCYQVDNNGYILEKSVKTKNDIVLQDLGNVEVKDSQQVVSKQFIAFFLNALDQIKKMNLKIKEAQIKETTFKIDFITDEGWKIIMDSNASVDNQIYALQQVLEKNKSDIKEYVDVRVEGVAFVK